MACGLFKVDCTQHDRYIGPRLWNVYVLVVLLTVRVVSLVEGEGNRVDRRRVWSVSVYCTHILM